MNCPISDNDAQPSLANVTKVDHQGKAQFDQLVVEEPLSITLCWQGKSEVFTITMRTPGQDEALATGLLYGEGQIRNIDDIERFALECDDRQVMPNQLQVHYRNGVEPQLDHLQRRLVSQSSCGICGKTSLRSLELQTDITPDKTEGWLTKAVIHRLPATLFDHQPLFQQTGGVHGAALFDSLGKLLTQAEDVGRHNAVDKVVGTRVLQKAPMGGQVILVVSGRVSFELVQKAVRAGYPVLVAVGAPSSLAVTAAKRFDITLIGFTRADRFNVYHGQWRLKKE